MKEMSQYVHPLYSEVRMFKATITCKESATLLQYTKVMEKSSQALKHI